MSSRLAIVAATVIIALCCSCPSVAEHHHLTNNDDCSLVARRFNDTLKTRDDQIFHDQKRLDMDVEICSSRHQKTCCSGAAERRLHELAVDEARDIIMLATSSLRTLVADNAVLYQQEYVDLLMAARNQTCRTVKDHLRVPVCQSITTLFDDLTSALLGSRQIDVHKSVTRFFDELFSLVVRRHVFGIVNRQHTAVDVEQSDCIASLRRTLKPDPLDSVDDQFADDVARAINSSRTVLEVLRLASRTVASATEDWSTSTSCRQALTRLRLCAVCDGRVDWSSLRPCRSLCLNVARGCLSSVTFHLGPRWEKFVDGFARLVASSHHPDDLQFLSKSLDGTVAGGVLHIIRNAPHFYSQVLDVCGTGGHDVIAPAPTQSLPQSRLPVAMLSRARRRGEELQSSIGQHHIRHQRQHHHSQQHQQHQQPGLHQRVEMLARYLLASRSLFTHLPDTLCSSETLSAGNYEICWNGTALSPYNRSVAAPSLEHQLTDNLEVNVTSNTSSNLQQWLSQLDNIINVHRRLSAAPSAMQADDWWTQRSKTSAQIIYDDPASDTGSGSGDDGDGRGQQRHSRWRVPIRDDDDYYTTFYYYYDYDTSGSGDDNIASGDGHFKTLATVSITSVMDFDFADRSTSSSRDVVRSSSVAPDTSTSAVSSVFHSRCCCLFIFVVVLLLVLVHRRPL